MSKEYLVTLNVPPALDEMVADCLLVFEFEFEISLMVLFKLDLIAFDCNIYIIKQYKKYLLCYNSI